MTNVDTAAADRSISVAIPKPLYTLFSYRVPETLPLPAPGARVRVPFGRQTLVGIRVGSTDSDTPPGAEPFRKPSVQLKDIVEVLDDAPLLPADVLDLATWAARYYHHPLGDVLSTALPTLLRKGTPTQRFVETELVLVNGAADGSRAPRQAAALEFVAAAGGRIGRAALTDAGFEARIVNRLLERGLLEIDTRLETQPLHPVAHPHDLVLTEEQRAACDTLAAQSSGVSLLEGITGSGKTEVYLRAIEAVLNVGRQALVLIPEIALTPQTVERFTARFGRVHVFHSGHTDLARAQVWQACRDGRARIAIGTRSAIWLPFVSLGLIVVDEEHDGSFKQQEGLRYSARDLAVKRAQSLGVPVVLGSATPSLESLHNAARGRYRHLRLTRRTGRAALPTLALVDIRGHPLVGGMSPPVQRSVQRHLDAGSQVLLFVNRRGYAPTLLCAACGWNAVCSQCDTRLTLHQRPNALLRCHHCGITEPAPRICPTCDGDSLVSLGLGTQRSEQGVERLFPDTPVLRIDRDSVRSAQRLEAQLAAIRSGRPAVLVGTQMLAKGHHFPNVTLVVVLNADAGFMSPDFRAPEHTAQLIVQVAGRAGREDRAGEVLIQTYNSDHSVLRALIAHGYDGFAAAELEIRAAARMPPHRSIALLRAEGRTHEQVIRALEALVIEQRNRLGLEVLGPAPAPLARLANRYRSQCLLTAERRTTLHDALDDLVRRHGDQHLAGVRWTLDVDPLDTF
jgi:primosomal protein N' (replication factor Y)